MTVDTTSNKIEENGNGIKTEFLFSFNLIDDSHLEVYKFTIDTNVSVLQVQGVDYVIPERALGQIGGTVVYTVAPAIGERSILIREVPITQETPIGVASILPSKAFEDAYDKTIMVCQQLDERLNRTFKSPIGTNPDDLDFTLPGLIAKKAFIVDDSGTQIIMSEDDYADQLANVTAKADEANTSANNAASSEANAASSATGADAARVLAVNSATDAANSATAANVSAGLADTARIASQAARDASEDFRDEAEGFRNEAETAKDDIIELFEQFPDLTPTDTGRIATVNDDGTGYDLISSGISGQVLTSNGPDSKPTYQPLTSSIPVIDNLTSTSATDALSANQGRILKSFTDTNAANNSTNTADIATNATNISTNASDIGVLTSDINDVENDITIITTRVDDAESDIIINTQDIATNAANIAVNSAAVAKLPVTNPTDTGRLAVVNPTGDAYELLAPGNAGQVLTSGGPNAIPTFENDSGGTIIIDDLLSTSAVDALSANQGRVLKGITDTNASAITANTNLINRIPTTATQDTGKLLAVDPNGVEFDLLSTGTAGQVLTSGGLNTLPSFQDAASGAGFSVKKITTAADITINAADFAAGFDIIYVERYTDITITIDLDYASYEEVVGKVIIIQSMDSNSCQVEFANVDFFRGNQFGDYEMFSYTKSLLTLLRTDAGTKGIFIEDQYGITEQQAINFKLSLYPGNPLNEKGKLLAVTEAGTAYDFIDNQGNPGDVLTSRGADLVPEFAPPAGGGSGEGFKINRIEVTQDYTVTLDEFDGDFDLVLLEVYGPADVTVNANNANFNSLIGKSIILQAMDGVTQDVFFTGFDTISGFQSGSYKLYGYTRSVLTLVSNSAQTTKVVFVDDQRSLTEVVRNTTQLNYYPGDPKNNKGKLIAVQEDGNMYNFLPTQGNIGDVLTSRGGDLLPEFTPPAVPAGVDTVKRIDVGGRNYTFLFTEFDDGSNTIILECTGSFILTISVSGYTGDYSLLAGRILIIQQMDDAITDVRFAGFDNIEGSRKDDFNLRPSTKANITLITDTGATEKNIFIDDQEWANYAEIDHQKISKYPLPVTSIKGRLLTINGTGNSIGVIDEGNAGDVLTSNGAGAQASFQPASGGGSGSMELISSVDVAGITNVDFVLPTDDANAIFKIFVKNATPASGSNPLFMRLSSDGGSTFYTDSSYGWIVLIPRSDGGSVFDAGSLNDSRIRLNYYAAGTTGYASNDITIFNACNAEETSLIADGITVTSSTGLRHRPIVEGHNDNKVVTNAIRLFFNISSFASGQISLYRIKS